MNELREFIVFFMTELRFLVSGGGARRAAERVPALAAQDALEVLHLESRCKAT